VNDNSKKIILDLCGGTGSWSQPYKDAGYDVRVITLPDIDVCDAKVRDHCVSLKPYGVLAAPPCTKFSRAAWQINKEDRDFKDGMRCVRACLDIIWTIQEDGARLQFWALENPDGYLAQFLGYPRYHFQPWWFGETDFRATKRTHLWGYFQEPRRIIRGRTLPLVSPFSRPAGDGTVDRNRLNKGWAKASVEDRARTSEYFAKAFFEANQ
jgi:hypothetical protein